MICDESLAQPLAAYWRRSLCGSTTRRGAALTPSESRIIHGCLNCCSSEIASAATTTSRSHLMEQLLQSGFVLSQAHCIAFD